MGYLNTTARCFLALLALPLPSLGRASAAPDHVILSPSLVEIAFALDAGDRIAAVSRYCGWPEEAQTLPRVGGGLDPSVEAILHFRPLRVITSGTTRPPALDPLERMGVAVAALPSNSIEDIYQNIRQMGLWLDREREAGALVQSLQARAGRLLDRLAGIPETDRPLILVFFGAESNLTAGRETFTAEVIRLAGGRNLGDQLAGPWPSLSPEGLLQANPDFILFSFSHPAQEKTMQHFIRDPRWMPLNAVRQNQVYAVPDSLLAIPGPRFIEAARAVQDLICTAD